MEKEVISIEAAAKEWNEFLESMDARSLIPDEEQKNGDEKQRGEYNARKNGYDKVVRAISRGVVVIENGVIAQHLQFPVKAKDNESIVLDKLVFNQRVATRDREEVFKNINDKDAGEALLAQRKFCSKLTGVDMILLGKVDLFDAKVTDQIVSVFFM